MDDTLRNRDAGRQPVAHDAGNDSPSSRNSAQPGPGSATDNSTAPVNAVSVANRNDTDAPANEIVTVCGWCPQLHILSIQRRDVDVISIVQFEKVLQIFRNGKELKVSHGICAPCSERLHPGTGERKYLAQRLEGWIEHARGENAVHVSIPIDVAEILLRKVKP